MMVMAADERDRALRLANARRAEALLMLSNEASELAYFVSLGDDPKPLDTGMLHTAMEELRAAEAAIAALRGQQPPEPRTPEMAAWVMGVTGLGFGA